MPCTAIELTNSWSNIPRGIFRIFPVRASIQAYVMQNQELLEALFEQGRALIEPLQVVYHGGVQPVTTNGTPGKALI